MDDRIRCAACGDVVGVFEAAVAYSSDGTARMTSVTREPQLTSTPGAVFHETCAPGLPIGEPASSAND